MKADVCAREGCTKKAIGDAFCSTECCREWHGCPLEYIIGRRADTERIPLCGTESAYKDGCRCDECRGHVNEKSRRRRARLREEKLAA